MRKLAFVGVILLAAVSAFAATFYKVDGSGNVVNVIVADDAHIAGRKDGPWRKVPAQKRIGVGWRFKNNALVPPADNPVVTQVDYSTPTAK